MITRTFPTARTQSRQRNTLSILVALVLIALLSGCGLRLEAAPPAEPTPDAAEITRSAMVSDVLLITDIATRFKEESDLEAPVIKQVDRILADAEVHLNALGGIYDSGLSEYRVPTTPPLPSGTATLPPATVDLLTSTLVDSYTRGRAALEAVPDPLAARLFASVALAEGLSGQLLAKSSGISVPGLLPEDASLTPLPTDLPSAEVPTVIATEDSYGYLFEIRAARLAGKARTKVEDEARAHRTRARIWANDTALAGTAKDPRQAVYTFTGGIPTTDKGIAKLAASLAQVQTHRLSGFIPEVDPALRSAALDLMTDSYLFAVSNGASRDSFPGMPEFVAPK